MLRSCCSFSRGYKVFSTPVGPSENPSLGPCSKKGGSLENKDFFRISVRKRSNTDGGSLREWILLEILLMAARGPDYLSGVDMRIPVL